MVCAVDARRAAAGSEVTVGVRPEHLTTTIASGDGRVRGVIAVVENLGDSALLYVRVAGAEALAVRGEGGASWARTGDPIELGIAAHAAHLFDGQGRAFPRTGMVRAIAQS